MYWYRAKAVNVVDGDTVDLDVDLGFRITMRMRMRLYGVDTPERGQPGYSEAIAFVRSKLFTDPLSNPKPVELNIRTNMDRSDKYGRMLVTIFTPGEEFSLNQQLVDGGMARSYDGGAR